MNETRCLNIESRISKVRQHKLKLDNSKTTENSFNPIQNVTVFFTEKVIFAFTSGHTVSSVFVHDGKRLANICSQIMLKFCMLCKLMTTSFAQNGHNTHNHPKKKPFIGKYNNKFTPRIAQLSGRRGSVLFKHLKKLILIFCENFVTSIIISK